MRKHLVALGVAAVLLSGCSAQAAPATSSAPAAASSAAAAASTPSATPTPTPTKAADAAAVATALKGKVTTITAVTPVTEANDSNKLIGRPGQYTSAAWINDSGATAGATGVDGGAVIEVFATPADAKTRSDYIQGALAKMGPAFGTEWHHLDGPTLLRVSGKLNPSVNDQYTAAFGK